MTAVLLIGYNRPENVIQRVKEISLNFPRHLYISIDGTNDVATRMQMVESVERAISKYSTTYETTIMWNEKNMGLSNHLNFAIDKVLEIERNIIVIEDDIRIPTNLVKNLDFALNHFKDFPNFGVAGGFSGIPLAGNMRINYWRRSTAFSAWGWAVGRETWSKFQLKLPNGNFDLHFQDSQSWNALPINQRIIWKKRFEKVRENPRKTWDFQMQYATFKYDLFHVLPLFRLCENIGFDDPRSTNTKSPRPKWMQPDVVSNTVIQKELPRKVSTLLERYVDPYTISGTIKTPKILSSQFRK